MSLTKYMMALNQAKAYTDSQRLAYTEGEKEIFSTELTPGQYYMVSGRSFELEVGKIYIVTTDSASYETTCKEHNTVLYLGNLSSLDSEVEDTGEPFVAVVGDLDGDITICVDGNGGSHFAISLKGTIHPIDPKYIPGAVLPVVELSTLPTETGATLTDEESARMDEVLAEGVSIMLKCHLEENLPCCCILDLANYPETPQFVNFNMGVGVVKRITGDWVVRLIGG